MRSFSSATMFIVTIGMLISTLSPAYAGWEEEDGYTQQVTHNRVDGASFGYDVASDSIYAKSDSDCPWFWFGWNYTQSWSYAQVRITKTYAYYGPDGVPGNFKITIGRSATGSCSGEGFIDSTGATSDANGKAGWTSLEPDAPETPIRLSYTEADSVVTTYYGQSYDYDRTAEVSFAAYASTVSGTGQGSPDDWNKSRADVTVGAPVDIP